ncbi:MAG: hypothetical protein CK530_12345 [Planctomycetaceae bacterium]|nr:MAG: hypothetical protein CK530_12345 [Planctomycetaceae bacterium]
MAQHVHFLSSNANNPKRKQSSLAAFFLDSQVCVAVWLTAEAFDRQTVVGETEGGFCRQTEV